MKNALFSWNVFHNEEYLILVNSGNLTISQDNLGSPISDVRTLNTIRLATIVCFLKVNDCGLNLNTKLINLRLPDLDSVLKSFP